MTCPFRNRALAGALSTLLLAALSSACASPPPALPSSAQRSPALSPAAVSAHPPAALAPLEALPPAPDPAHQEIDDPLWQRLVGILDERAPQLDPAQSEEVARELVRAEQEDGLPALLLVALIAQESRFDPQAVGPRGSRGLMQIRPFVASAVAERHALPYQDTVDLFDPVLNVRIGVAFLAELQAEFGDLELALAAYHVGPTRVRARAKKGWRPRGPYVRRVMVRYQTLRVESGELETAVGG